MEKKSSGYDNYRQTDQNRRSAVPQRGQTVPQRRQTAAPQRAQAAPQRRQASAPQRGQAVPQRRQSAAPQRGQTAPQRRQASAPQRRSASASYERNVQNNTRMRRRRRRKSGVTIFLILFLVLAVVCGAGAVLLYQNSQNNTGNRTETAGKKSGFLDKLADSVKPGKSKKVPEVTVSLDSLDSPYAIMIDADTGTVIGSKQGDVKIFPASMAKVMTVLTAIENIKDLDQKITMSYDYYDMLYEQDASRAGFEPGEEAVIRDLLYGALLPSGAECCMQLAIQAAGSEDAFAELMNQKAQELGLTQTQFTNCTGLHNENQYSTPQEIALILKAALKNKTFREVFTTHSYSVKPSNIHPEGFTFWSSMFKNMQAENVIGGEIMGGKTGYTQAAGYCLVSMAEVEDREYIQVTAGWASNPRVNLYHINDAFLGYNTLGRELAALREQ